MSKQPKLTHASSARGADMGRRDALPLDPAAPVKLHLARLAMSDGGCYDAGGAYWGCGSAASGGMWCAWTYGDGATRYALSCPLGAQDYAADGVRVFIRATTREAAKAAVLAKVPGARFYR